MKFFTDRKDRKNGLHVCLHKKKLIPALDQVMMHTFTEMRQMNVKLFSQKKEQEHDK